MKNNARALLFALIAAVFLGKNVLAEVPLGAVVIGPAPHLKAEPSVAGNGRDYFAVWRDSRTGKSEELVGTRVAADGTILDPTGIRIGNTRPASAPRVISAGGAWMCVSTRAGDRSIPRRASSAPAARRLISARTAWPAWPGRGRERSRPCRCRW